MVRMLQQPMKIMQNKSFLLAAPRGGTLSAGLLIFVVVDSIAEEISTTGDNVSVSSCCCVVVYRLLIEPVDLATILI